MYIRKTKKRDRITQKEYFTFQLVESIRTEQGPRQRIVLNLGQLQLSTPDLKLLAQRIQEELNGSPSFFRGSEEIEQLVEQFIAQIVKKSTTGQGESRKTETIDLDSLEHSECRTVGVEHIAYETIKKLELESVLRQAKLSPRQIEVAIGTIVARLVAPSSERATHEWLRSSSAIDELLGTDFSKLSLRIAYEVGDRLMEHKRLIENHLRKTERSLFDLNETVVLYDLTNTYFEGTSESCKASARGRSKEKRHDAPLVTLGLVMDSAGFPIRSEMLPGNVSEPSSLETALSCLSVPSAIVVLDAGIATEANLAYLKKMNYRYIVASRSRSVDIPDNPTPQTIKTKNGDVHVIQVEDKDTQETRLYCRSASRELKERGMQNRLQKRFEEGLRQVAAALTRKNGVKAYPKVIERIGRLNERYKAIARFYSIQVKSNEEGTKATSVSWDIDEKKMEQRFQGGYLIRAHGLKMTDEKLWKTYVMLTQVESAFRALKTNLGLRPIWHRIDRRVEGHLFITMLAYHVLQSVLHQLRSAELPMSWETLRRRMATQVRVTSSFHLSAGGQVRVRTTTRPEASHRQIYQALGISATPGRRKIVHG